MKMFFLIITVMLIFTITNQAQKADMKNPFFNEWNTPFQTTPFNEIKDEHYLPAFEEGIKQKETEILKITNSKEIPTFINTIEALEKSGQLLTKVQKVFNNLIAANGDDNMQSIAKQVAPLLSKIQDDIYLNQGLFARIKFLHDKKKGLNFTTEQNKVLDNYYSDFVRGGANLNSADQVTLRKINEELSVLSVRFDENILKETNAIGLVIENKDDLVGLPENVIQDAAETAKSKGFDGKWAFTLQRTSWTPFLQYSEKRNLREKLFKGYISRGNNNNELDTKKILDRMVILRVKKAQLLGFKTHADFVLERNMAKNPQAVYKLLNDLWKPALKRAGMEAGDMQKIINKEGKDFKLAAWDWWYFAEKVKKEKYALDEEMLRPYFKLENVRDGAFEVAGKLYGLKFIERKDILVYQPDVKVFEVKEANGKHIGILYTDYYTRDSKKSGAWMDDFRTQSNLDGHFITPIVYNCTNFSKPLGDKPTLLSIDEVTTLFHEFGHALHGLLSHSNYPSVCGTNVPTDFVELFSQFMENWATDPEILKMYAKHYKTNEPMPQQLIDKLEDSNLFNQGFETVEYLAASFLDMDWHTISDTTERNVTEFEKASLAKIGLIPEIESRYQSTNFLHIFSSDGYSSGYYSYIWSAVLDADAFEAFKETGLFNKKTADSFRKNLLSKGGSDDPMTLYKKFRGREPKVDALLKKRGLN
jgi:peptidyl-dipeptidase Dcp